MILKFFFLTTVLLVCEGTIPDRLYYRRAPLRFIFGNQGMRRPQPAWNYQIVNGRPVISGFPNSNSYVAFGLNPQTGQIEQTQIITQTRPGGPFINLIQNMLNVAGQFFGQLTGAAGNAFAGALQTAGKFSQDIQDLTNPVISVTGISHPNQPNEKEPIQQPNQPGTEGIVRPPVTPSVQTPTVPSSETATTLAVETVPEQSKSDFQSVISIMDQAIISLQTFRTNFQGNFQNILEGEDGESTLTKINENVNWAVDQLQSLKETAIVEPVKALQSGQSTVNTAFDGIESHVSKVVGTQGVDFIEPTRNELNKSFNDALELYQQTNAATEIIPSF